MLIAEPAEEMAEVRTKAEPAVVFIILSVLQASREIELYHKISADSWYSIVTIGSPKYALGTEVASESLGAPSAKSHSLAPQMSNPS